MTNKKIIILIGIAISIIIIILRFIGMCYQT